MNTFLGIDPDMHDMPIAEVDGAGTLVRIDIIRVPKTIIGREALIEMSQQIQLHCRTTTTVITVEGQEWYQFGPSKTKNPKSIGFLATVAGQAMVSYSNFHSKKYFPTPHEWKGTVPKQIHQARVLARMGVEYEKTTNQHGTGYCFPKGFAIGSIKLTKTDWKHAVDAIGLAQYGRELFQSEQARKARAEREQV